MGGSALFITNIAEHFGLLSKTQAEGLDKAFGFVAAVGTLINGLARLAPMLRSSAVIRSMINIATNLADLAAGPPGWILLAGAATALAAWGLSDAIRQHENDPGPVGPSTTPGQGGMDVRVWNMSPIGSSTQTVNVEVDARGMTPDEVGREVRRHIEAVMR